MTEPTDAELDELRQANGGKLNFVTFSGFRTIARAVLEKWGNPAVAGEQVGWMWQHDETGRTGFVDCWQVENGWQEGNPRLRLISKLYATPQPTQAQAGAVPLTDEQVESLLYKYGYDPDDEHMAEMLQAAVSLKRTPHAG
jgi:hypothetical protein